MVRAPFARLRVTGFKRARHEWRRRAAGLVAAIVPSLALCPDAGAVLVRDHRNPSTAGSAYRLEATPIFELPVRLTAGMGVTWETRNASARADPVLHLLAPLGGPGPVREVAQDDDSAGSLNARLTYTPAASGVYLLVMRAAWNGRGGTVLLYQNGRPVATLPLGGIFKRLVALRSGETLQTIPLPRGPRTHVTYVVDERGRLTQRYTSAANEVTFRVVDSARAEILLVAPVWPDVPSPIRLVRNDVSLAGHDPDGDGLGTELEANIGTCSALTGISGNWECSRAMDARDTDGDGLMDGVELIGRLDQPPYQWLPRWGADPRHKDLFVEVDFMRRSRDEPFQRLTAARAMEMVNIYGDAETDQVLRLLHAQTLRNPDMQPGIRLHLDTGMSPPASAPESEHSAYGDWGGHSAVAPVCDGDVCVGADSSDVWRREMHPSRHGLFHYALGYAGDGGQASNHTVDLNLPLENASTAAHELGHTLGLDHNGPHGDRLDANCKANYPSIMNYAYLDRGWKHFSDGHGRPVMNNVNLVERGQSDSPGGPAGRRFLEALHDVFLYNVDLSTGDVDWNRDGVFRAGTTRAYSNDNGSGCEMTRNNSMRLDARSTRAPALTRLGRMTLAFFINEQNSLGYAYTSDSLACPQGAPEGCGPPMTVKHVGESWNHGIVAFDAHPTERNGQQIGLLVYRTVQNRLFEVTFTGENLDWTPPREVQTAYPVFGDVSLAGNASTTYLAYRNAAGLSIFKVRDPSSGAWSPDAVVRDAAGGPIPSLGPGSSPGLLLAPMPAGAWTLYGLFPLGNEGRLRLYTYDSAGLRWAPAPWPIGEGGDQLGEPSIGRPALAYVPVPPESLLSGRLHVLSMRRHPERTTVRERMLTARLTPTGATIGFGSGSDHDNSWFYGYGIDLLFEPGVDTNLRSLISVKPYKDGVLQPPFLQLRPKADGIVDMALRNWNDWEVLRVDLCRTLVASGSTGVRCPAWEW